MQVRTYTAKNVREELQAAQRDFIRASVGVSSKGKLLVPKMLHSFAKGFVDDTNLALWILHYLPPHQAAFLEQCIAQRRQSLLGSRNCGILPFDSRFRYLFLPDKIPLWYTHASVGTNIAPNYTLLAWSQANKKIMLALDHAKNKKLGCISGVKLDLLENNKDGGSKQLYPPRPRVLYILFVDKNCPTVLVGNSCFSEKKKKKKK